MQIPQNDLAHIRHENHGFVATETIFLVSTPRSGSTMLSTSIDPVNGCPMAEYFQPYEIIPYLEQMRRKQICFGLFGRYRFSPRKYAAYLKEYRSGPSETLAINFHHSHLPIYEKVQPYLPPTRAIGILVRRDIIAQAVSYYIAGHTRKWSSNYTAQAACPEYNRAEIGACLRTLIEGVETNVAYFKPKGADLLFYEDYIANSPSYAAQLNLPEANRSGRVMTKRQSDALNTELVDHFRTDIADQKDDFSNLLDRYQEALN